MVRRECIVDRGRGDLDRRRNCLFKAQPVYCLTKNSDFMKTVPAFTGFCVCLAMICMATVSPRFCLADDPLAAAVSRGCSEG